MTTRRGDPLDRLEGVLAECSALARSALEPFLARQAGRPYLGPLVADYPSREGSMLGAALCLTTVRACGGRTSEGLNIAAAIELSHNATRINQDLIVQRNWRSGRQTLHRLWGDPLAINAADSLMLMSLQPLLENGGRLGSRLSIQMLRHLEVMARQGIEGWMTECFWRLDGILAPDESDYLRVALAKTCWPQVIGPLLMGACIARIETTHFESWLRFGFFWGVALKMRIEVDSWRSVVETGESVESLGMGHYDLPFVRLVALSQKDDQSRLRELLHSTEANASSDRVLEIGKRIADAGCLETSLATSKTMRQAALCEAELLVEFLPATQERDLLLDLAVWEGPPLESF